MARYMTSGESVAAATAITFASLQAGASCGFKLRRVLVGVRAGASVPTSQQLTVAWGRVTVRGLTPTSTTTGVAFDPNSAASAVTGLDMGTFGTVPTMATLMGRQSFNSQSGWDMPFELLEELACATGTANGIGFQNVGNALPASHLYTLTVEWEE